MFRYDIMMLDRATSRFVTRTAEADSFARAVSLLFEKDRRLASRDLIFYCRKPRSRDLQYMGEYDPKISVSDSGESIGHLLLLSNGDSYEYTDDGFRKVFASLKATSDLWRKPRH